MDDPLESDPGRGTLGRMITDDILAKLRAHEPELRAAGVASLSLIGSVARGDARDNSDVDVVVRLSEDVAGFAYFGRLDRLGRRLETILGRPVDVVAEPVRKDRLKRGIEKDLTVAF
jgi:predicted nucleotidyltransferase